MNYKRFTILLFGLYLCVNSNAQISTNEKPVSFGLDAEKANESLKSVQTITMPALDMDKIRAEDKEDEEYDMPPRFGYQHKVDYNLTNSGTWMELLNGDKLWRLNVVCPGALSVNFCYDKFWLPEGGKLFVYSKDKKHTIGAFTNQNNKGDRKNIRGFATGLVYGDNVVLEYYQPKDVTEEAIISIEYVIHGYRYIYVGNSKGLGDSGDCMVNVNCEEGRNWQNEKKAVAMIVVYGFRLCTGSLINTTNLSQTPFFLTADHCTSNSGDAVDNPFLDYYTFYWNYEAPGCDNINIQPNYYSTSGATIVANNLYSDFTLLKLTEDPQSLSNYTPYYLGWDCSGQNGGVGVCIHHPEGDIKKISTVGSEPNTFADYYWRVTLKETENGHGTVAPGSSGSALLTNTHKVIGQLRSSNTNGCENVNGSCLYGKFNLSWSGVNNDSIHRRLDCWLDSLGTGYQTLEGLLIIPSRSIINTNQQLYSNIRITSSGQFEVQSALALMGNNSQVVVESGGQLIINGGVFSNVDLVLKPGSVLKIINGGKLKTRNGFEAPEGSTVEVIYGQIL